MESILDRMTRAAWDANERAIENLRAGRAELAARVLRVIELHPGDNDMAVSLIKKMAEDAR
jgi:predicted phosphatase